jgi:release factor glutamine methyltransferase
VRIEPSPSSGRAKPTWRRLLRSAEQSLGSVAEARWAIERASGWEGGELWRHLDDLAPTRAAAFLDGMVQRRRAGEPLQYALGRWSFRGLELLVDRRVLIPRPETEVVAGAAIVAARALAGGRPTVVDLGTGSGAIGLAIAAEVPGARVWATDVSSDALAVARANVAGSGSATGTRVRLVEGSWWDALPDELRGAVDVVVCNPPYVGNEGDLPPEVGDWEPTGALRAGPTGREALEVVVGGAAEWLARPGVLVVELAPDQAEAMAAFALRSGFAAVHVGDDLAGRPRMLVARI